LYRLGHESEYWTSAEIDRLGHESEYWTSAEIDRLGHSSGYLTLAEIVETAWVVSNGVSWTLAEIVASAWPSGRVGIGKFDFS